MHQRWGFQSGQRFASCLRGGSTGKFSAGWRCTGASCRFHSQEATRHRYQACQGRCGHTFPPPGGSWYPIRNTWVRIGHQAINGLEEGVWHRTVEDLGSEGYRRLVCYLPILTTSVLEWMKRGSYKTAWVAPRHDCLCLYKYGHGAAVRPQINNAIWDGVIGLWSKVVPFLSPWCGKKDVPTGVNLNQYAGQGSFIRWHGDNEPLYGPQNSPKFIIVSSSLRNSVEFMVRRRASGNFPSSIRLEPW